MESLAYRFVGLRSFDASEHSLLFGREELAGTLEMLLTVNPAVVLHGDSGSGKTSLSRVIVQASDDLREWEPFFIRIPRAFDALKDRAGQAIIDRILAALPETAERPIFNPVPDVMDALQLLTVYRDGNQKILLVFDQFEEALALAPAAFAELIAQFQGLRPALKSTGARFAKNKPVLQPVEYISARVKCLFIIRSDKLAGLDNLTDIFPDLYREMLQVRPFTRYEAASVLTATAAAAGNFKTPPFRFESNVVDRLVDRLAGSEDGRVDPVLLQLLGYWIEENIVIKRGIDVIGTNADIDFDDIVSDFYHSAFADLVERDRNLLHKIITSELIQEWQGAGLKKPELLSNIIQKYDIEERLLFTLVDRRVLKTVLSARGPVVEIAHDILLPVIYKLKSANEQRALAEEMSANQLLLQEQVQHEQMKKGIEMAELIKRKKAKQSSMIWQLFFVSTIVNLLLILYLLFKK